MKRNHLLLALLLALFMPWAAMAQTQNVLFSDDFEGSSCEWNLIDGTQPNQWAWDTAISNGGTHALYISNDGGGSNAYTNSLYSIVYATRHIAFGTGEYTIAYDWKANGESNYDYLRAWLAPEITELTAGQLPNGMGANGISSYINTTPDGWVSLDGGSKLNLSEAWQSQSSTVNVEAGNYMLVFMWANDGSVGTNPPAAIDNVSIVSNCAIIPTASLPYVEDFDSYPYYSANDLPICWSYINTSTGSHTYPQMESGSSHNSSANALSLYSYSYCNESTIFVNDPQPQYAILPEIQDVSRLKMTLWARARSMDNSATVTYDATFKVGVMTDPTDASAFVQIGDPITPQSTTYEQYTISFDNYTGNGTYIAIMIDAASTISDQPQASHDYHRWVCIDDITVELNCDAPTNVTVSSITTTTATADWVGSPAAQSYTVRYREAIAATPSFSEGFENGLGDWTFYSGNQANDIGSTSSNEPAGIFPSAAHSGDNGFRFSSFQNFVDQGETNASYWQYLTSPEFELSGPSVLRFYHKKYSNLYYESLYVGYITDLDNPQETTFTSPEIHPTEDWQCYILDLPSDAKKVFFSYYGEHTYFIYLDDITIAPAGEWQSVNNISATTFMLSNLTMDTEYDFQVKSDCSDEWSQAVSFATQGCTYPVLSTWDFEDATPGQLPQCWTRMGSSPTKPLVHNIYHFSGTQYLEFYHASPDDATLIAVMPAIDADLNTLRVEFYGKQTYGNDPAFIQVGYVTDLNDPESYGHAKTFYMTDTPAKYTAFFNNAPTDGYIAFKTTYLNQQFAIVVDDVTVKELGCEAVTNLQVTETGSNSITLDWDGQDDAEFYIYYLNQTTQESMRTPGTVRPPYTLEDLTSNTSYTIRVTAECNVVNSNPYDQSLVATMDVRTNFCPAPTDITVTPIDATSVDVSWTGSSEAASYTLSYRTMAIAGDNPIHTQGFEDGMGDWFIGNESMGYPTYAGICTEAAHSGDHSFKLTGFIEEGNAREALLFGMSQITEPSVLRFYYKRNAASSDVFLVFSFYSEYYGQQWWPLNPTEDWQLFTMDLPDDVVGIEFDYYGPGLNSDAGVFIDDITISPVAQAAGEMQTVDNITDTNHTLTGLVEDTDYELYVYSDCSMAASPVFFSTTPCFAPTDVEVSDILHTSATVTWTSESENYTMSYREAERPAILLEEDFSSSSIPSGWSTYTGVLSDVMNGTAQLVENNATNYTNWRMANTTIFGAYSACCNIYATTNKWLVTPEFTFNTSGSLSFDLAQTSYNSSSAPTGDRTDDRFVVLIFSDDQWTILREWNNNTGSDYVFNDITNTRQTISDIDLSAYVGKTVKIAFYGESTVSNNGDNDIHIDNVAINVMVPATPWQTIPDIAATTYDLTNLTAGTEYEVKVQAACGEESEVVSFTTLSLNHKIFVNEGYWNEPNNWLPVGAPTIDQDVELRADVTIPNGYLATANQIEETWEHGITIEDGGQLYHTNYLLATVKKHVGGYGQENQGTNNGYILLAQPIQYTVSVEPNDESNIRTGVYDFYAWSRLGDNEGKEWINYGASNTSGLPMDEGNGYLYASQEDRELTFLANIRGNADAYPINNLEYTVPTSGAMFTAWNLIGNSFACNVYLTNARTNGSALPFYKMNADGNGFEAAIGTTIAPMEGVFYEKPASTTSYQPWFTRTQPTRSSNINISLAQGSAAATIDNAIIRFDDGETMGKLSFRECSSKVYIPVEGKDLAVAQAEGQVGEFPVNFKAEEDGTYTLSFTSEEVEFCYLHLIDNLIGNDVDLLSQDVISTEGKKSPSYTFTAKTTDDENRFKLVFATDVSQVDHLAFKAKDAGGLRSAALTPHVPEHQQTENQDADLFVQAISLVQGWNWWAPMAKISAAQLRTVLGSTLLELKAKEGDVAADDDLVPGQMYKLQTSADFEGVLNGLMAPASNISEPGVYWIGYTGETSSSITQALVSVNIFPNAGDKIISQDGGFAIFVYPGWTWQGTLTELRHGQGYVYIHVAQ